MAKSFETLSLVMGILSNQFNNWSGADSNAHAHPHTQTVLDWKFFYFFKKSKFMPICGYSKLQLCWSKNQYGINSAHAHTHRGKMLRFWGKIISKFKRSTLCAKSQHKFGFLIYCVYGRWKKNDIHKETFRFQSEFGSGEALPSGGLRENQRISKTSKTKTRLKIDQQNIENVLETLIELQFIEHERNRHLVYMWYVCSYFFLRSRWFILMNSRCMNVHFSICSTPMNTKHK